MSERPSDHEEIIVQARWSSCEISPWIESQSLEDHIRRTCCVEIRRARGRLILTPTTNSDARTLSAVLRGLKFAREYLEITVT